jgi:hypothetical protein
VSPEIWAGHYGAPLDEREIARHYTLTSDDLEIVGRRRGDATRLGYAMLMLYMRWPGRALEAGEVPPTPVLAYVAQQLGVAPAAFADYAHRDQTRREHLVEIRRSHGFRIFDRNAFRDVVAFSIPIAQTIIHPGQMAGVIVDELRRRQILLPSRRFSKRCCGRRASKPNSLPMKCSRMACCPTPFKAWTICWPDDRGRPRHGYPGCAMRHSRRQRATSCA